MDTMALDINRFVAGGSVTGGHARSWGWRTCHPSPGVVFRPTGGRKMGPNCALTYIKSLRDNQFT